MYDKGVVTTCQAYNQYRQIYYQKKHDVRHPDKLRPKVISRMDDQEGDAIVEKKQTQNIRLGQMQRKAIMKVLELGDEDDRAPKNHQYHYGDGYLQ